LQQRRVVQFRWPIASFTIPAHRAQPFIFTIARMRRLLFIVVVLSLIAGWLIAADEPAVTYASAAAAYKAGDYKSYRDQMLKLVARRPNQPLLLFDLAGGYALTGEPALAAATLEGVAGYGVWFDLSDHDFDPARKDRRFKKAAARLAAVHSR